MNHHPQQDQQELEEAPSSISTPTKTKTPTVRFWWIRHGETVANRDGIVVGQWDSPLSTLGRAQARALGQHHFFVETTLWKRRYASDLGRTRETIKLIMGENDQKDHSSDAAHPPFVRSDARIREIAKGARQEFPKSWDYDRALEERRTLGMDLEVKLETASEAWHRIADFITSVLAEVYVDESRETRQSQMPPNVMVVSHAGVIRTLLAKVAPNSHPSLQSHNDDGGDDDPSRPPPNDNTKRLQVPNTSVTILDVTMTPAFVKALQEPTMMARNKKNEDDGTVVTLQHHHFMENLQPGKNYHDLWTTRVVEFLWTGHLQEEEGGGGGGVVEATSNDE